MRDASHKLTRPRAKPPFPFRGSNTERKTPTASPASFGPRPAQLEGASMVLARLDARRKPN